VVLNESDERELRQAVTDAAARSDVAAGVEAIYAELSRRIEQRRPVCVVSGRCCRFEDYGHRLYVTTAELATFVRAAGGLPAGQDNPGGCRFQVNKLCTVHTARPFGCRIFFCDSTASEWQQQQYEVFHTELKRLHDQLDVPYFYVEWRAALEALSEGFPKAR